MLRGGTLGRILVFNLSILPEAVPDPESSWRNSERAVQSLHSTAARAAFHTSVIVAILLFYLPIVLVSINLPVILQQEEEICNASECVCVLMIGQSNF